MDAMAFFSDRALGGDRNCSFLPVGGERIGGLAIEGVGLGDPTKVSNADGLWTCFAAAAVFLQVAARRQGSKTTMRQ